MSDKITKNQDHKPDQNPEAVAPTDNTSELDIDSFLAEVDPEFMKQLNKIKIETTVHESSILDQALGLDSKSHSNVLAVLRRPFELKTNYKSVLIFWLTVGLSVLAIKMAWNFKNSLLSQNLFLNSLAELGAEVVEYNPNTEVEAFYDNPKFSKNLVTISAMHVNLKASENSTNNPMLAIEITAEGLSSDAIVEIKDREAEFKDKLLRLTEEKTYDELIETDGKQLLCEQYRDLLNMHLTSGQVRRILLKTFIIKP